jgi:AcrR family transcriptional regulator
MDKKELMDEAMHIFSLKGFAQTSIQEIALAAGISKGAFYKHYESKESLFIELLKRHQEELTAELSASSFEGIRDRKAA